MQTLNKKDIKVSTIRYENALGKKPHGKNKWVFQFDINNIWYPDDNLTYSEARKLAIERAIKLGIKKIIVLP